MNLENLVRKNIAALQPYSSARDEFKGAAEIYLDANENSLGSPVNIDLSRYPDPLQWNLKIQIGKVVGIEPEKIFLGNGSDEAIDLLYRIFCEPGGKDRAIILPPTYGMYKVSAAINDVAIEEIPLTSEFQLPPDLNEKIGSHSAKLLFICSPNNPTGNAFPLWQIEELLQIFNGIVVVDEAYQDFSSEESAISLIDKYANLVVMRTFSKAWGLAAARLGLAFSNPEIISYFNKVKPPYNINQLSINIGTEALNNLERMKDKVAVLIQERAILAEKLSQIPFVEKIYPSDANFILIKVDQASLRYLQLLEKGIIVRNRSKEIHCENCLRITVGTPSENLKLIEVLENL